MTDTKTKQSSKPAKQVLNPSVNIVGFAPSWSSTPWEDKSDLWGMNALHKVAGDHNWSRWYQLHDIDEHHTTDRDEHLGWLNGNDIPVVMWEQHLDKYDIKGAVRYPREEVIEMFGRYFTNTVSWMIAHAIYEGRKKIGVYGVDMAQDSEYGNQRPSCEYFIGWARGKSIDVFIPENSDLLKAPYLYGAEDPGPFRLKMVQRQKELVERRGQLQNQLNENQAHLHQVVGALEDTQYWLRAWTMEGGGDSNAAT